MRADTCGAADISDIAKYPRVPGIVAAAFRRSLCLRSYYRIVGQAADRLRAGIILAENSSWPARWWLPSVREMTVRISSNFAAPPAEFSARSVFLF